MSVFYNVLKLLFIIIDIQFKDCIINDIKKAQHAGLFLLESY